MRKVMDSEFALAFEEATRHSVEDITYRCRQLLKQIDVRNKDVLDIGCGTGLYSFFLGSYGGARRVVGIDPSEGEGSPDNVHEVFARNAQKLALKNVEFVRADFRTASFDTKFDIILAISALHHVYETTRNMLVDPDAKNEYRKILKQIYDLLNDGGNLIIMEASRSHFTQITRKFGFHGRGYMKNMSWNTKQVPTAWMTLLKEISFVDIEMNYWVPYRLRAMDFLLKNPVSNYLTTAAYVVRAGRSMRQ